MKYQLVLLDKKTGQPQKVEVIDGVLDLKQPLQKRLYVDTLNSLTSKRDVVVHHEDGDDLVIRLKPKNPKTQQTDKEVPSAAIYEPEEQSPISTDDKGQAQTEDEQEGIPAPAGDSKSVDQPPVTPKKKVKKKKI